MKVTHLNAANPTLKGHMVGVTREEAQRLISSLARQLGGHPLHEEFSDDTGDYFALCLMGADEEAEAELDGFLDAEAAQDEALRRHEDSRGRLTKEELAAAVKPVDQQLPDESNDCTECGAVTDGSADLCDACWEPHRLRQESGRALVAARKAGHAAAPDADNLSGAAAFFRSAALSGEEVGPDHCDACRRAYAALDGRGAEPDSAGCCFALVDDPGDDCHGLFLVATREFWDANGHLDGHITGSVPMPAGFDEVMESVFRFDGDGDAGRAALLSAGFEDNPDMLP